MASQSPVEKLANTYLTEVLPRYTSLRGLLAGKGADDLKTILNWVRDVFGAIKKYSVKNQELERDNAALKKENTELRGQIQELMQKNHELEEAVSIALRLDENK